MQRKMGKAVIVENKPGAGGILGNDVVAKATPDGYTLGVMTAGQIIAAVTKKNMPYDTNTAFAPVSQIATASLMIVTRPDFPANNVKELVAYAKANPGKIVFASPGFAATQHFAGEMFKQTAGVELLHVPFKTTPEAINAVLGKHADVLFDTVSAVIGQVKAGQLKALAVTGKDRFPAVPDVPPAADSGVLPGYDVTTWYGVFAPAGTPPAVIAKLNKVLNEALREDDVRKRMDRGRRPRQRLDAGRVRQVPRERIQALGQGSRGGGHRAAVTSGASPSPARPASIERMMASKAPATSSMSSVGHREGLAGLDRLGEGLQQHAERVDRRIDRRFRLLRRPARWSARFRRAPRPSLWCRTP